MFTRILCILFYWVDYFESNWPSDFWRNIIMQQYNPVYIYLYVFHTPFFNEVYCNIYLVRLLCVFMHLFLKVCMKGWKITSLWTPSKKILYHLLESEINYSHSLWQKCSVPFNLHILRRNSVSVDNIKYSLSVWSSFPPQGHQQQKFS